MARPVLPGRQAPLAPLAFKVQLWSVLKVPPVPLDPPERKA